MTFSPTAFLSKIAYDIYKTGFIHLPMQTRYLYEARDVNKQRICCPHPGQAIDVGENGIDVQARMMRASNY